MSTPKHSKEPWTDDTEAAGEAAKMCEDVSYEDTHVLSEVDWQHAKACVNALAGVNPEAVPELVKFAKDVGRLAADWGERERIKPRQEEVLRNMASAALAKAEAP